ncbi:MAG: Na(+)/H(+) antiporter subunit D, partial [Peptococcaceae bacterium]|nr:Na(+)/H(+) antiporter subunit D [Peptococcaceae bacterium]
MSNLHPGLILILAGIIAAILPKQFRKFAVVGGPLLALASVFTLEVGALWTIPFINGMDLHLIDVDKMGWMFALVFSLMAVMGGFYVSHSESWLECMASMMYAGSILGVVLCGDWMTMIFFWELGAATSLFLIWCNNTPASRKAGFRYLLVHMTGGNLLLAGVFLLVSNGDFLIHSLTGMGGAAYWLILLGVGINAAVVPLHAWITDAYPEATVAGSVFMGAFTTKMAAFCMIRLFSGSEIMIYLGVFMALYASCFVIIENDMRRLLAFHIVGQIGFIVAGLGVGNALGINGAAAHAFTNVLFKSLLFMAVGAIIYTTGIRKINELGGMYKKLPLVTLFFFIAAFSISGVPFFTGFVSKSVIMTGAAEAGLLWVEMCLKIASIATFVSITLKMGYFIFFGEDNDKVVVQRKVPMGMYIAMGIDAVLCVLFGVFPDLLYNMLPMEMEYHVFTVDHFMAYIQLLGVSMIPFMMYLDHMKPHSQLSLDFDWFYRKPFKKLIHSISSL